MTASSSFPTAASFNSSAIHLYQQLSSSPTAAYFNSSAIHLYQQLSSSPTAASFNSSAPEQLRVLGFIYTSS